MIDRRSLEQKYLALVELYLPQAARRYGWPIHEDHCFARVILDNLCGDIWYRYFKKPAYRNIPTELLEQAVQMAEQFLKEPNLLVEANQRSLSYRSNPNRSEPQLRI